MKRFILPLSILLAIFLVTTACSKGKDSSQQSKGDNHLENIAGTWNGSITISNQPLPISVTFTGDKGTISIPVQGVIDFPLSSIKLNDSTLSFVMNIQGERLTFDGKIENEEIDGTFKQQGMSYPFELTKGIDEEVAEEQDFIQIEIAEGTMYGVLETPEGEGPFPVMIIIAGSGPTDKDGNSILLPGKNNSLKMLAEDLAAEGIASIRYDKRGVGKNISLIGKEEDLQFTDFIDDAVAWTKFAQNDSRFSKVGIIGHSEGSLIGMVASEKVKADAFISLAGAGQTIDKVLMEQLQTLPPNLKEEAHHILEQLKQGHQVKKISAEFQSLFRPSVQPYIISWLKYNPEQQITHLTMPVLLINGTRDLQVPESEAITLQNAKSDAELLIIDKMNHILKEAPDHEEGNMATYSNPDLPLAPQLIDGIATFLKKAQILP